MQLETTGTSEQKAANIHKLVDLVNSSDISSIKSSLSAIVRVINDPRSTVKELKEVILLDPPLAAKVLKTANSAYYSRSFTRVFTDIEQAIIWMGSEIIKELALGQKVCEVFDRDEKIETYSRRSLWKHSIAVAMMAKMIYRKEFGMKGENAYVAGLLHDIGIIAEDQFLPEAFKTILRLSTDQNVNMCRAEVQILGYDHTEVGEAILASWGLPAELTTTIGSHHNPLESRPEYSIIAAALYASDLICQERGFSFGAVPESDKQAFRQCLDIIDVKPYALDLIFKEMTAEIAKMEDKGLI